MPNPGDEFAGDLEKKYAGSYDRDATKWVAEAGQPPQPKLYRAYRGRTCF